MYCEILERAKSGCGCAACDATAWPQLKQNFAAGLSLVPQLVQAIVSAVPQFWQNVAPSGLAAWQLGHFIYFSPVQITPA
jgi:hypothetical protein